MAWGFFLFHAGTRVCETFLQGCPFLKRSLVNGLRLRARKMGSSLSRNVHHQRPALAVAPSVDHAIEHDYLPLRA